MMGCPTFPFADERRMPLYLLNNILGGPGMNARLNIALRERHGLVYTVESTLVSYGDTGTWGIYFGCDHDDVDRCQRLVRRELNRLLQAPLSPQQLRAAKQQLKGQIGVATDNREQFALDFGKSFLYDGRERDIELLFRQIDAVTAEQMHSVACEFFAPERLSTLIIE
jgi:predicted Zn-dependent peptidase